VRLLIHDYSGHPFQVQLSRALAQRGHDVLHLYSSSFQTPKGSLIKKAEDLPGFNVEPIDVGSAYPKYSYFKRRFADIQYGKALNDRIKLFSPDVVVSCNTPLDAQWIVTKFCADSRIKFIFWVQDLYGVAIEKFLTKKWSFLGGLVGKYYRRIARQIYSLSDEIVVISDDFTKTTDLWETSRTKMHVIPNWAPLEEIVPRPKINTWSTQHGLADHFNFLYSGTLGLKHDPNLFLQLSQHFQHNDTVRIVVISEGLAADWLKVQKAKLHLNNLVLLGFQPFDRFSEVLSTADVFVTILEREAGVFSVPSKVLSYLCAGRPLLLSVPAENLSAKIVSQNRAGLVVDPQDEKGFLEAAGLMLADPAARSRMSQNSRAYAERFFDINMICNKFEKILERH
jgi:glycosyltransferase involved in cell wall biosynthesis